MKLYVWDCVLKSYYCGIAFAFAKSIEQARELVVGLPNVEEYRNWLAHPDDNHQLWTDLQEEPTIYNEPMGYYDYGGG